MALIWHGAARAETVVNLGPLALIQPLLQVNYGLGITGNYKCYPALATRDQKYRECRAAKSRAEAERAA
jgi:hypothetical protein